MTERCIKGDTSGKSDDVERSEHVRMFTTHRIPDSVLRSSSFEKRSFHIETLLYNKCREQVEKLNE